MSQAVLIPVIVVAFVAVFSAMWLGITALLGAISGWSGLEKAFPDRPEPAIETLRYQIGRMRGVNFNYCLRFEICSTGLRVSMLPLLGPFRKPFFVPWAQIGAERRQLVLIEAVMLSFGEQGKMLIRASAFERMAAVGNLRAD
jgi:hypothetical protein